IALGGLPAGALPVDPSLLAAALLLLTGLATTTKRQAQADQAWFQGRAVAESVKTACWRYMMRVAPYADDASADAELASVLRRVARASPLVRLRLTPEDAEQPLISPP